MKVKTKKRISELLFFFRSAGPLPAERVFAQEIKYSLKRNEDEEPEQTCIHQKC